MLQFNGIFDLSMSQYGAFLSSNIRTFVGKLFGVRVSAFWSHTFCCRSVAEGDRENSRRMSSAELNANKLCKTSHDDHIS